MDVDNVSCGCCLLIFPTPARGYAIGISEFTKQKEKRGCLLIFNYCLWVPSMDVHVWPPGRASGVGASRQVKGE